MVHTDFYVLARQLWNISDSCLELVDGKTCIDEYRKSGKIQILGKKTQKCQVLRKTHYWKKLCFPGI